jgi:hypothetical protein
MYGLTIRWSLSGAPAGTEQALRDYVREEGVERFRDLPGLHQKTWQMAEHGFFSGVYIWATTEARADFLERFRANPSRVTQLLGTGPELVQEWDVVGVAIGAEGPLADS